MNSQQVSDLKLLYNAVYDENLREKADEYNHMVRDEDIVEVATEYFYNYGLNESGVNILIEKVGLDNFVEFVCSLSEDLIFLNEARKTSKAKKQEGSLASRQRAKLEAQRAARERTETERKAPESKGADTEAKSEQPKQKPKKDGISRAVSGALDTFKRGMQNHNAAVENTGKTLRNIAGRLGGVAREVGSGASGAARLAGHIASKGIREEVEEWVNSLVEEGYDLSDYTWDEMEEIYMTELYKGRHGQSDEEHMDSRSDAAKQISGDSKHSGASYSHRSYRGVGKPAKPGERQEHQGRMTDDDRNFLAYRKANLKAGKVHKVGGEKGLPESYDHFDYLLEYLVAEGYADTNENALKIMANMSEEWRESIIDEAYVDYKKGKLPSGRTPQQAAQGKADLLNAKERNRPIGQLDGTWGRQQHQDRITKEMGAHTAGNPISRAVRRGLGNMLPGGEPSTDRHRDAMDRRNSAKAKKKSRG